MNTLIILAAWMLAAEQPLVAPDQGRSPTCLRNIMDHTLDYVDERLPAWVPQARRVLTHNVAPFMDKYLGAWGFLGTAAAFLAASTAISGLHHEVTLKSLGDLPQGPFVHSLRLGLATLAGVLDFYVLASGMSYLAGKASELSKHKAYDLGNDGPLQRKSCCRRASSMTLETS